MIESVVRLVLGLGAVVAGAELVVRGGVALGAALRISPLIVGLTVVAYGTSAPELAISVGSVLEDRGDLSLGNVIGSNILNILLILGISATFGSLKVDRRLVRLDVPLMVVVSLLFGLALMDGSLDRLEGILLLAGSVIYTVLLLRDPKGRLETPDTPDRPRWLPAAGLVLVGLALLTVGAGQAVDGASGVARQLGMSELLVGLTIVAIGTSLPELAASVAAALKGHREMAVGNVVGSNLFNLLLVGGAAGTIAPEGVSVPEAALRLDLPVMIAVAVACLPIFYTGWRVDRWEGLLFLGYFVAYTLYLILDAKGHPARVMYGHVVVNVLLPATGAALLFLTFRAFRRGNAS